MKKVYRIKLSELKKMIKEEKQKVILEQRPKMEETDSPPFGTDEFIQWLTAAHYKSKRGMGSIRSPRGVKSAGPGRPEEFYVDTPSGVTKLTAKEIIDLYDPKGKMAFDVYDMDGGYLAKVTLDWELGERAA